MSLIGWISREQFISTVAAQGDLDLTGSKLRQQISRQDGSICKRLVEKVRKLLYPFLHFRGIEEHQFVFDAEGARGLGGKSALVEGTLLKADRKAFQLPVASGRRRRA